MKRALTRTATTVLVALAAGAGSLYIAVAGDGDGLTVTAASRLASGYLPYTLIVFLVGATAPSALHAVLRAVASQLIMVWGYYTWGPMVTFTTTPETAMHYAQKWTQVAVLGVPVAALAAYAVGWCVRQSPRVPDTDRTPHSASQQRDVTGPLATVHPLRPRDTAGQRTR
ncbi:hypothetical protein ACFP1Z_22595 [Streptomyces gamaensis]|uniref:Uncharacterized protein n=1 Tax=Streptomyces gamaensis TaxID=1763542 RepID=A0ABW0Z298_9ACTN